MELGRRHRWLSVRVNDAYPAWALNKLPHDNLVHSGRETCRIP
jgi:hypothetical protein